MLTALLLFAPALAGPLLLGLGGTSTFNDPFVRESGLRLGAELALSERVRVGLAGTYTPSLGDGTDWTPLTHQLVENNHVSPDISRPTWTGAALLRIVPVQAEGRWLRVNAGVYAGLSAIHTEDDLDALQADPGDARAESTASQTHPGTLFGLSGELWVWRHLGFRHYVEWMRYVEAVHATTLESKAAGRTGGEVLWRF